MITITTVNAKAQDLIEYFESAGLTDYILDQQEYSTSFSFITTSIELSDLQYLSIDTLGKSFQSPISIHTDWKHWIYRYDESATLVLIYVHNARNTPVNWKKQTELHAKVELVKLLGSEFKDVYFKST